MQLSFISALVSSVPPWPGTQFSPLGCFWMSYRHPERVGFDYNLSAHLLCNFVTVFFQLFFTWHQAWPRMVILKSPASPKSRLLGKEQQEAKGTCQTQKIRCSFLYGVWEGKEGGRKREKKRRKTKDDMGFSVLLSWRYEQRAGVPQEL